MCIQSCTNFVYKSCKFVQDLYPNLYIKLVYLCTTKLSDKLYSHLYIYFVQV